MVSIEFRIMDLESKIDQVSTKLDAIMKILTRNDIVYPPELKSTDAEETFP